MIYRSKRENNFTIIDNQVFKENGLSFAAMGMLSAILSKPDNWVVKPNHLWKAYPGGKHSVSKILNELIDARYVIRNDKYTSKGHGNIKRSTFYEFFDYPQETNQSKQKDDKTREHENWDHENHNHENHNHEDRDILLSTDNYKELNILSTDNNKKNNPLSPFSKGGTDSFFENENSATLLDKDGNPVLDQPAANIKAQAAAQPAAEPEEDAEAEKAKASSKEKRKTSAKKKKEVFKAGLDLFPPEWQADQKFVDTWTDWITYRKEIEKPYKSQIGYKKVVSGIIKLSKGLSSLASQIVDQSLESGWQGFFELKNNTSNFKQSNTFTSNRKTNEREQTIIINGEEYTKARLEICYGPYKRRGKPFEQFVEEYFKIDSNDFKRMYSIPPAS